MKNKLDPNKVFSVFKNTDVEIYRENSMDDLLGNPYVILAMVLNAVMSYEKLDAMYLNSEKYSKTYKEKRPSIKNVYFEKIFFMLDTIGSPKELSFDDYHKKLVIESLSKVLRYFEDKEEFEKCARILPILELAKK